MVQLDQKTLSGSNNTLPIDELPNLGKVKRLPVPDFNDPQRPKVCLEVDFPIAPINALARLEATSGAAKKPIYLMSKWYARRQSSVFRSLLIAAATKSPDDPTHAAKCVWDHYYCNHQKAKSFTNLRVLDLFMGGGTTIVEGNRLGFKMTGIDLNPIAWFITKNEISCTDPEKVKKYFDYIEEQVKHIIQPFYTTSCPRGHKGEWIDNETGISVNIDPTVLPPEARHQYVWNGPEVIYTFWAKHGTCQKAGCNHRTPLFRTPIIAEKKFSIQCIPTTCSRCGNQFNVELGETRIAPGSERVILDTEPAFTETSQEFAQLLNEYNEGSKDDKKSRIKKILQLFDSEPAFKCPACGEVSSTRTRDILEKHFRAIKAVDIKKKDFNIEKRKIYTYLLIHPVWLKGSPGIVDGNELGGYSGAAPKDTEGWWESRLKDLALIEVRGRVIITDKTDLQEENRTGTHKDGNDDQNTNDNKDSKKYGLPPVVLLKDGTSIFTDKANVPKDSKFQCKSCGLEQVLLESEKLTKHNPPIAAYALQCYCPECAKENYNYNGKYFKPVDKSDLKNLISAELEWSTLSKTILEPYWPKMPIEYSMRTHIKDPLPDHGYTHWWKMFNSRQLLVHTNILKIISESKKDTWSIDVINQALGAFQQYLRSQSSFSFYHVKNDQIAAALSNSNYNPKQLTIETCVFSNIGSGRWGAYVDNVLSGLKWANSPSDPIINRDVPTVAIGDSINSESIKLYCQSSTDLSFIDDLSYDLIITDPPFGNNIYYADMADFFYVWLRTPLLKLYEGMEEKAYFETSRTPHSIEAIDNAVEHPDIREEWQKSPAIITKHLDIIQKTTGDLSLKESDLNPLYQPNPSSDFYKKTLSACWSEGARILKPGGIMAFTFHHSEDAPWVDVLESLFNAGFILVATYPIKSDETKGESAEFGSKKIEYDIIHVCRKRLDDPQPVSWAKMRKWVRDETKQLRDLLEHTHGKELNEEDLRVILRGKALEFYSRHYGQILTGYNQNLTVPEALLGINQILEDIVQYEGARESQRPPSTAEPKSRLILDIFLGRETITRDELSKRLRGTGITPDDLEIMGWIRITGTSIRVIPIKQRFGYLTASGRNRKNIKTDLDQAHFLIGAAIEKSGFDIINELDRETFHLKKSSDDIIRWYSENSQDDEIKRASKIAIDLINQWRKKSQQTQKFVQKTLFDTLEEE